MNIGTKLIGLKIHHHFQLFFMRNRFFQLQAAVHFPQIDGDRSKLQKVKAVVQHFSQQFQEHYVPEQQVSIDENLIGFEGRRPTIQYIPNKHHHRFGLKLFCLCESSTGYTYSFSEGKDKNCSEHGLWTWVAKPFYKLDINLIFTLT